MSRLVTKPTKWHVRQAKPQISLGIRPVWSESSLSAWRKLGCWATHWAHSEDSDQTGRMPRLIWVFTGRRVVLLCPATRKWRGIMLYPPKFWVSVRPSVRLSVCLSVRPSVRPSVSAHHHSCIGNSSYSFRPILLKLYRCFKDGLKICILFFLNPEIIFYYFFPIFNLDIFRALILQICIWSMYLVSATPPVFWRILLKLYRCFKDGLKICILFFQNPEIIFYHFFRIFNLDIFRALILQICIWSMYLVSATPPTVFGESFWNFTGVLRMVWRYAYCFFRVLKLFFLSLFTHF